jgi:hypothetical protein
LCLCVCMCEIVCVWFVMKQERLPVAAVITIGLAPDIGCGA